jgi:hypothetical protein
VRCTCLHGELVIDSNRMTVSTMELGIQCTRIVDRLLEVKINFLAIDFDNTLISFHTDETDVSMRLCPFFCDMLYSSFNESTCISQ